MRPPLQSARADIAALQRIVPSSKAARDVLAERRRQIEAEGWTLEHDDAHQTGDLALAGSVYAFFARNDDRHRHALMLASAGESPVSWPWDDRWWKPKDRRRDLVKAGALILAEIERLDRLAKAET